MSQYQFGNVDVENGLATVIGHGTFWATEAVAGNLFSIANENVWYEILSVEDDTHLTLKTDYVGTTKTASRYAIQRDFTPNQTYPIPAYGDTNISSLLKQTLLKLDSYLASFSPLIASLQGDVSASGEIDITIAAGSTLRLASYTKATAPNAATAGEGSMIYVTDTTGGPSICISDGAQWNMLVLSTPMA